MIGHLVFNCQSSRVDAWDALKQSPRRLRPLAKRTEDGRLRQGYGEPRRTEDGGRRSEVRVSQFLISAFYFLLDGCSVWRNPSSRSSAIWRWSAGCPIITSSPPSDR